MPTQLIRSQAQFALRGLRYCVRNPSSLVRLASVLNALDGWSVGVVLGNQLDPRRRREAAAALLAPERVVVGFDSGGIPWFVPSGDRILAEMLGTGSYEGAERDAVVGWVRSQDYLKGRSRVVEVGANVGTTTIPLVRSGFRVLAIEPVPRTVGLLRENIHANGASDSVVVVEAACSGNSGKVTMREANGGSEVVTATLQEIAERHGNEYLSFRGDGTEVVVRASPLDELLLEHSCEPRDVAFVWSDTEGHETSVIETGVELWRAGVPAWIELWPSGLAQHAGLDKFDRAVRAHFSHFVLSNDLLADGPSAIPQPIGELADLVRRRLDAEPAWWSTDVLLIPARPQA